MLAHHEVIKNYEEDRSYRQAVLDERIPDLHFARYGQNDDVMTGVNPCEFTGEYNIIAKERRRVMAELRKNEIECKFRIEDDDDDEIDETMQGMYRTDRRDSKTEQIINTAEEDAIDCGFGSWMFRAVYEAPEDPLNTNLKPQRVALPESVRKVFWDANSVMSDKSDAQRCSVIHDFTEAGYKQFLIDNGIDPDKVGFTSFDSPYQSVYELYYHRSLLYPLFSSTYRKLSILESFSLEPENETFYIYANEETNELYSLTKAKAEELEMPEPLQKKRIKIKKCFRYVTNGSDLLVNREPVHGDIIPVVSMYGERNFVNGVENFYGIVKAGKDPQKLLNSCLNFLANMMMYSPVPKPEFDKREIEGVERYHEGAANSHQLAYALRNKLWKDPETGETYTFDNATYTRQPEIPQTVSELMAVLPSLLEGIMASPGISDTTFDTNASGKALENIQEVIGMMTYIYLDRKAEAIRRDAEIWQAMTVSMYDTEREVTITNSDGKTAVKKVNEFGDFLTFNDNGELDVVDNNRNVIANKKFKVYHDIGASYQSRRDATLASLKEYLNTLDPNDPLRQIVTLNILSKEDGEGMDELNDYARLTLLEMGLPGFKPQNEAEKEFVMQVNNQRMQDQIMSQNQPDYMQEMIEVEKQGKQIEMIDTISKAKLNDEKAKTEQANRISKLIDARINSKELQLKERDQIFNNRQQMLQNQVDLTDSLYEASQGLM